MLTQLAARPNEVGRSRSSVDAHRPTPNRSGHALALKQRWPSEIQSGGSLSEPVAPTGAAADGRCETQGRVDMTATRKQGRNGTPRSSARATLFACPFRTSTTAAIPVCRRRRALRSRRSKRIPAASASSPTSRAASRTRSSRTRSRSSAISSIAARSVPIRAPATVPASWCRSRTSSSPSKPTSSASRCRRPANTRSASCSCRAIRIGGRSSATSMRR